MRKISVKVKITIWYLLLMSFTSVLLLGFLMFISDSVSAGTAMDQLDQTLRNNIGQTALADDGSLQLGEDFDFYNNGVYTLVYSQNESLLAGQLPVSFDTDESFQNGLTRQVTIGDARYYILDFWVPAGWDNGVWLRGVLEVSENILVIRNLMKVALVSMPLVILLAGLGGYFIARRAFLPLEKITSTAEDINEAADLSRRVDVPKGENEFTRLACTFNRMFARLERSFEAEKQFTSDASHELRTPVSVIKSACEYAEKYGASPEEQRETIAMIRRQADKMSVLIGQLLSIARLDQGTGIINKEETNLTELVETVCEGQVWPQSRLICHAQQGITAYVDSGLMIRLLQNLIDNGFKYGKPEGHVWVSLEKDANEIRLSVRDDGIGIGKEAQEKVWQRFYQTDPSRGGKGGAGLGLSIVQKIAQIHGGSMTLKSIQDHGSIFTLHLPQKDVN